MLRTVRDGSILTMPMLENTPPWIVPRRIFRIMSCSLPAMLPG